MKVGRPVGSEIAKFWSQLPAGLLKERKMKENEHNIQVASINWFRYQYPSQLIMSIPNGGQRNKIVAGKMKAEGVLSGVPDIFIPAARNGFHGLWIELKSGKNKLTDNQRIVIGELMKQGYRCEICYSLDEFMNVVNKYLN